MTNDKYYGLYLTKIINLPTPNKYKKKLYILYNKYNYLL